MVRVKRSKTAKKKRKKALKATKGFRWGRKSKYRAAKEALMHARTYQYRDRRRKKRERRALWQIKINAAVRQLGLTYSQFIAGLKKRKIEIDRKILANLAEENPAVFKEIVNKIKV
ncbi:MAG: 50S ribosomal protein L20 [Parcubacteria group bacterium CG_4_9_14_0_2_um_filter_35_11]|nr:MAG: 50S ribosomal protein L20 [Parcubacteria group bacterium CG07_land_8_20_14_0_80_35_11]PJC47476.1 MAG: 50S ribosomal protein L20 [Parcubacteria group bacterium CG_4_9_14_0_2_um_filter_35_11]